MSERTRTIQSVYYLSRAVKKTTSALYVTNVVPNAVRHLQSNDYAADRVEIFDSVTGTLYAVLRAKLNGTAKPAIHVIFEREGTRAIKKEHDEQ